jgi:serine/threonine-protein kinase HipA
VNIKALGIFIGKQRVGVLFQYALTGAQDRADAPVISRFVADVAFIGMAEPPTVSISYLASTPEEQLVFWRDVKSFPFNGRYSNRNGWLLPAFFQNLLPEGVFRDHVARLRGCSPTDHFDMLAACGKDLPGNVHALPVELSRDEMARYVTQHQDALEMSVTAAPMDEGVSLSGVQPKLGVISQNDRYVGRTKDQDTHIIAKLPVVGQPRLPELEHLSLQLAAAAGVNVCKAYLEPLEKLAVRHGYDLGDADCKTSFLAVVRYDRAPGKRMHCEDFAQILGEMPEDKYGGLKRKTEPRTYLSIAAVLLSFASTGEPAVHELLRRLAVNEMLGNPDMHLKNVGLCYPDGRTPAFPPAYDIVAYSAFNSNTGHALPILPPALLPRALQPHAGGEARIRQALTPALVRAFCAALRIPEKPAAKAIADCVRAACETWPAMIDASGITGQQKRRLLAHFHAHPLVASLARRKQAHGGAPQR